MESTGDLLPRSIEHILSTSEIAVQANSYKTRGKPIELDIQGTKNFWHSLKGGLNAADERKNPIADGTSYEVLFAPATKQWLKIVPPEVKRLEGYDRQMERLKTSGQIARVTLDVAGLGELAPDVKDVMVQIRGEEVYGFLSPHIGPSLEYLMYHLTGSRRPAELPSDAKQFFSVAYDEAFDQAKYLYTNHGIWTSDPNPGNILLHSKNGSLHVVLIDFSNHDQKRDYLFAEHIRKDKLSPDAYEQILARAQGKYLRVLQTKFAEMCTSLGVPFRKTSE